MAEFREEFDIKLEHAAEAMVGVSERYPFRAICLNRIGKSDTAKRIQSQLGWTPAHQVVRTQLLTTYFTDNFRSNVEEGIFLECLSTSFTVEDRSASADPYTAIVVDPKSRIVTNRAAELVVKALDKIERMKEAVNDGGVGSEVGDVRLVNIDRDNEAISAACAATTGLYVGGQLSGNEFGEAYMEAVGDQAGITTEEVWRFVDQKNIDVADQALRMAYRNEGINLSVGNNNLSPRVLK